MTLRDVKILAIAVIVASLATTNFIVPTYLDTLTPVYVTAISRPSQPDAILEPEPSRPMSAAKAEAMRAHADRVLADEGELQRHMHTDAARAPGEGALKCIAGCN